MAVHGLIEQQNAEETVGHTNGSMVDVRNAQLVVPNLAESNGVLSYQRLFPRQQ
jgi:hypothetical protein